MVLTIRDFVSVGTFKLRFSRNGIAMSSGAKKSYEGINPDVFYAGINDTIITYKKATNNRATKVVEGDHGDQVSFNGSCDDNKRSSLDNYRLADTSFQNILDSINEKRNRTKLASILGWTFSVIAIGLAFAGAVPASAMTICLAVLGVIYGKRIDSYKRTTVIFYDLSPDIARSYEELTTAFDGLMGCQKKCHITSQHEINDTATRKQNAGAASLVQKNPTHLEYKLLDVIKSNITPPTFQIGKHLLYFLPDIMLIDCGIRVSAIRYTDLYLTQKSSQFIEEEPPPSDAKIVGHVWKHPNKSGGPDRRFNSNRLLPICLYGRLKLQSGDYLNDCFEFSKKSTVERFASALHKMRQGWLASAETSISQTQCLAEQNSVSTQNETLLNTVNEHNRRVTELLKNQRAIETSKEQSNKNSQKAQIYVDDQVASRWLFPNETANIAGRTISGMVYVGKPGAQEEPCNSLIDPSLPVASIGNDRSSCELPYWPSYSSITPKARATYLEWLANGRSDPAYDVGYVFLYFYGLERRFFIDHPDKPEQQLIFCEVERLRQIYGNNGAIRQYLGAFLDIARLALFDTHTEVETPVFERDGWELPIKVRLVIGCILAVSESIPAEWMLSWLLTHPETDLRTPATRAFPEFKELFLLRFREKFPEGLKIKKPEKKLNIQYRSASGTFNGKITGNESEIPDIAGLTKPVSIAREIAEQVIDDLDKFSRYLGRSPDGRGTIEAFVLLPPELRSLFPCGDLETLKIWLQPYLDGDGFVSVDDLVEKIEGKQPQSIKKTQLINVTEVLGLMGIGYAPDLNFGIRQPKQGEQIKVFSLPEDGTQSGSFCISYESLLLSIHVGSFIAHADGKIANQERERLAGLISKNREINEREKTTLLANLDWALVNPLDFASLKRNTKDLSIDARHEFGRLALSVASADGYIDPKEINAIKKLYTALELDSNSVVSDLHSLITSSEPVTVYKPSHKPLDYAIPVAPEDAPVQIDLNRVQAIMRDTEKASEVLHAIFSDPSASVPEENMPKEDSPKTDVFGGLDHKHRSLVQELIRAHEWTSDSFSKLSAQFDLMPLGAMEIINEWSYDRFEEPLIEDSENIEINREVVAQLTF